MNAKMVSDAMSEVDGKYIGEALFYDAKASHPRRFRSLPAALIAAVLALLLMGTGVAVSMIYGDSIQSWFSHEWKEITGQAMSEEHRAVIESLSQEIGVSQTVGGVTITVDSATVGDDRYCFLLKIDGVDIPDNTHVYRFLSSYMATAGNSFVLATGSKFSQDFLRVDGDGGVFLLLTCERFSDSGLWQDSSTVRVSITLQDLARDPYTDKETIIAEGEWKFSFYIDRKPIETISLPDIEVKAMEIGPLGHAETTVTITNIELTSMGLHFQYHDQDGTIFLQEQVIAAILKDGSIISNGCMYNGWERERGMFSLYRWRVPINLDEVAAIQFGETRIEIPQN